MALHTTFTMRLGPEHSDALDQLSFTYRRSRADALRLLIEREAKRLEAMAGGIDPLALPERGGCHA